MYLWNGMNKNVLCTQRTSSYPTHVDVVGLGSTAAFQFGDNWVERNERNYETSYWHGGLSIANSNVGRNHREAASECLLVNGGLC